MMFLDADDELPNFIAVHALAKARKAEADIVWMDVYSHIDKEVMYAFSPTGDFANSNFTKIVAKMANDSKKFFSFAGKLFRSELLQECVKKINVLAANRIILSEDLLIMSFLMELKPKIINLKRLGYDVF